MVGIVAVNRFSEAGSGVFSSYINYIDRREAVRESNQCKFNIFSGYMDYMDNDMKTIARQQAQLEKMSALFTQDQDVLSADAKAGLKQSFRTAQENGSILWQTVISFDNNYLEQVGLWDSEMRLLNEPQLRNAARKAIAELLRREHLEHATWCGAFHYNTDNIHIHIAITEQQPMREKRWYTRYRRNAEGLLVLDEQGGKIPEKDEDGNPVRYEAYKGTFRQSSLEALKSVLRSELENNRQTYQDITKLMRDTLIGDLKGCRLLEIPAFEERMLDLHQRLVSTAVPRRNWQYNHHALKELRTEIDGISDLYLTSCHKEDYEQFLDKLKEESARQTTAYGGSDNRYADNMLHGKEGLYARLGNVILKQIAAYDRDMKKQIREVRTIMKELEVPNGNSGRIDPVDAIRKLENLSDRGNSHAMNELGLIYLKGQYGDRDIQKAKAYFRNSAMQGNAFGQKMYEKLQQKKHYVMFGLINNYNARCSRQMRKGFRLLERNLKQTYLQYRNMQEAERLQQEIAMRGEEESI